MISQRGDYSALSTTRKPNTKDKNRPQICARISSGHTSMRSVHPSSRLELQHETFPSFCYLTGPISYKTSAIFTVNSMGDGLKWIIIRLSSTWRAIRDIVHLPEQFRPSPSGGRAETPLGGEQYHVLPYKWKIFPYYSSSR